MNSAAALSGSLHRVLWTQFVLTVAAAGAYLVWYGRSGGPAAALAAMYGGGVALAGTWLLARRVRLAGAPVGGGAGGQLAMYAGAVTRFVATLVLLAAGIGWLKLAPIPLILAFGLAQLGFLINSGAGSRTRG